MYVSIKREAETVEYFVVDRKILRFRVSDKQSKVVVELRQVKDIVGKFNLEILAVFFFSLLVAVHKRGSVVSRKKCSVALETSQRHKPKIRTKCQKYAYGLQYLNRFPVDCHFVHYVPPTKSSLSI